MAQSRKVKKGLFVLAGMALAALVFLAVQVFYGSLALGDVRVEQAVVDAAVLDTAAGTRLTVNLDVVSSGTVIRAHSCQWQGDTLIITLKGGLAGGAKAQSPYLLVVEDARLAKVQRLYIAAGGDKEEIPVAKAES